MSYLSELNNFLCNSLENMLKNVCKDLGKEEETERILKKFLRQEKVYKTITKTKQVKNKRKKTAYSMFLKYNKIRKNNPDMTLEEYNIYKGEYWKNISSEEKARYTKLADEWNEKNKTTKQLKEQNVSVEVEKKKDKEIDLLDCFFDDEYLKDKDVKKKVEEI